MNFKIFILFIAIYLIKLTSFAQSADEVLSKFFAIQLDESVFMRWTISAGNTCEDTYIERSPDGISYERIGLIGGICGSPDQSITYEFTDTVPLINQNAYYRLLLGYYGHSSPQVVEFVRFNDKGFLLAPNPFSDFTRLAFKNDKKEEYVMIINNMQGRIVQKMMTTGDEFIIRRIDLGTGVFSFRVQKTGKVIFSGRIVVN
jgi:hypothetical protein